MCLVPTRVPTPSTQRKHAKDRSRTVVPYMSRHGQGWRFAFRLPSAISGIFNRTDSLGERRSGLLRISCGPMTKRDARTIGPRLAAICRDHFATATAELEALNMHVEGAEQSLGTNDLSTRERQIAERAIVGAQAALAAVAAGEFKTAIPALTGLLDRAKAFDMLSRTNPKMAPVLLQGASNLVDDLTKTFASFSLDRSTAEPVDPDLTSRSEFPEKKSRTRTRKAKAKEIRNFSQVSERYLSKHRKDGTMGEKDVRRYEKILNTFMRLYGDRLTNQYETDDLDDFLELIETVPLYTDLSMISLDEFGEFIVPPAVHDKKLSAASIVSILAPIRSIMAGECKRLRITDPFAPVRYERPKTNAPYRPLKAEVINQAISLGVERDNLMSSLMIPLSILTARRIGLLSYLNASWLEKSGDYYIVRPTREVELPNGRGRVPVKTDESLMAFALHQYLVERGIVQFIEETGFLFPDILTVDDPASAASKRMNRILRSAGAGGRPVGETFHSIRTRAITHYRRHVPDAVRIQAGHAAADVHEAYDWAEVTPEIVPRVATCPLPEGICFDPIDGLGLPELRRIAAERPRQQTFKGYRRGWSFG